MKICFYVFHKNAFDYYRKDWIKKCIETVLMQTIDSFDVLELNYGGKQEFVVPEHPKGKVFRFVENFEDISQSMNFLLDKAFCEMNYDIAFNVNIDDFYDLDRAKTQLAMMSTFDIVSSNFRSVNDDNKVLNETKFDKLSIFHELVEKNHNIFAHPAVCMSKNFWMKHRYYSSDEARKGREDMDLWIRALKNGAKFGIASSPLMYYRIHSNKVCDRINRNEIYN